MRRERLFVFTSIAPALGLVVLAYGVTIGMLIVTSFFEWKGFRIGSFVGLNNYTRMITDPLESRIFLRAIYNNLTWSIVAVAIHLPLAIVAALILHTKIKLWRVFRVIFFFPHLISIAAFAIIFKQVYNPSIGLLNDILELVGFTELAKTNWLFDPVWAWPAIISTWLFHIGFFTIIYLAELHSIPSDLIEASKVEGCTTFQEIRFITIPLMRNIIGTTAILTVTGGLKYFEGIYLMTNGGPGYRTTTLAVYLYQKVGIMQNGYANALGVALLLIGIGVVVFFSRLFRLSRSTYNP
jgi:raffinose/stachyose/melibiose transport system permease protein